MTFPISMSTFPISMPTFPISMKFHVQFSKVSMKKFGKKLKKKVHPNFKIKNILEK